VLKFLCEISLENVFIVNLLCALRSELEKLWRELSGWASSLSIVEILKHQLATRFTGSNDYRADFWKIVPGNFWMGIVSPVSKDSSTTALPCMLSNNRQTNAHLHTAVHTHIHIFTHKKNHADTDTHITHTHTNALTQKYIHIYQTLKIYTHIPNIIPRDYVTMSWIYINTHHIYM